ncbi:MAG: hypothetical protein M1587_03545 [Thaumarchaeota archaeon]|nr:hypothetical protein [Nitrososphaerota archaeon]
MNLSFLLIVYTPAPYFVFLVILYFLSYFRDPLRFAHPQKEKGQETWRQVLIRLGLVSERQLSSQKKKRKILKSYVILLALALVQPIGGWILSSSGAFSFSSFLDEGFSLLLQFSSAIVVVVFVVIPSLGGTAPVWRRYVSNLGAPKRRLGSRVSHLAELSKQQPEKSQERRLPQSQTVLDRGRNNELLSGRVRDALPPASVHEESRADEKGLDDQESEDEARAHQGVVQKQ